MKVDLDAIVAALAPGYAPESVVTVDIQTTSFEQRDGSGALMLTITEVDSLVITIKLGKAR